MNHIARILAMFLIAQFLGLFIGMQLVGNREVYKDMNVTPNQQSGDVDNSLIFISYVIVVAVAIVLLIRYTNWAFPLFKIFEVLMIFGTSTFAFFVVLSYLNAPYIYELTVGLAVLLILLKMTRPAFKNVTAIIASACAGALFGFSFDIVPTLIFILLISIYDFVSVFITKHMVYMAKEMSKMDLSFSVASREKVKRRGKKAEEFSVELGGGDLAIPVMLAVSAYKMSYNIIDPLAVILGSSIGLVLVLYYVTKNKVFLPALPPLGFFGVLFLGLARVMTLLLH